MAAPMSAQSQPETVKVATRLVKPFAFEEGGSLTGFSIELWQEINILLNARTEYVVKPNVVGMLDATQSGEVDLAISAISITEEREKNWDFSQPMFDAGLQVLVGTAGGGGGGIGRILGALFNASFLPTLVFVVVGAILAGHVTWLFESRRANGLLNNRAYFPGIFEATFWAASTLATQAEEMPKSPAARIVAVIWMFIAVIFVAFFTAAVTSSLTVQQLRGDIQGPDDLPGRTVATLRGSTSADYLKRNSVTASEFNTVDEAIDALMKGDAEAVVYDAPILRYYASHEGKGKVQVVGTVFRKESYGILFPTDSRLRKPVNEALLRIKENGTYDRLMNKWFGEENGKGS